MKKSQKIVLRIRRVNKFISDFMIFGYTIIRLLIFFMILNFFGENSIEINWVIKFILSLYVIFPLYNELFNKLFYKIVDLY